MGKLKRGYRKTQKVLNFDYDSIPENFQKVLEKLEYLENYNRELKNEMYSLHHQLDKIKKNYDYVSLETLLLPEFFSTGKKKLLICGFYGAINLGDELMLETLLKNKELEDNYDITIMLSDNPKVDITRYGKYNFIHYPQNTTDFNALANYYDCILFGGGALIDDYAFDEEVTLGKILIELTMRFITFGKKTFLYGLSTNKELKNKDFINKLGFIVENATYFSLRDTYSLKVLEDCGLNTSRIKLVDDIVISNNYISKEIKSKSTKKIGIIYICSDDNYKQLEDYTKKLINYLDNKNKKYDIFLIPFYNYLNNDERIYKELLENLGNKNIKVIDFPDTLEKLQTALNETDYVISMRYHGTLIANLMNKKVLNIIYSKHRHYENKMKYMYEKYGFEDNAIMYGESLKEDNLDMLFGTKKITSYDTLSKQANKSIQDMIKMMKE